MIGKEIINQAPVSFSEVKEFIIEREKEKGELKYEQRLILDYVNKFTKLDIESSKNLIKELQEGLNLKKEIAIKIADLLPEDSDDLKTIFAKEKVNIGEEHIKIILETIAKYR